MNPGLDWLQIRQSLTKLRAGTQSLAKVLPHSVNKPQYRQFTVILEVFRFQKRTLDDKKLAKGLN